MKLIYTVQLLNLPRFHIYCVNIRKYSERFAEMLQHGVWSITLLLIIFFGEKELIFTYAVQRGLVWKEHFSLAAHFSRIFK